MTNIITNACAAVAALINIHATTNLQSLAKDDLDEFWTLQFQEIDASRYQYAPSLFIDPWTFNMPDINLNRIPRASQEIHRPNEEPQRYPLQ